MRMNDFWERFLRFKRVLCSSQLISWCRYRTVLQAKIDKQVSCRFSWISNVYSPRMVEKWSATCLLILMLVLGSHRSAFLFLFVSSKVENASCPCTESIMATHQFQSVLLEISSPLLDFSFLIAAFVFFSSHMAFNASKLFKISVDNFNRNIISSLKTQSKDHRQFNKSSAWERQVSVIYHPGYLKAMPLLCLTIAQGKQ